jgi:ceramide glucosyltransferase
MLLLIALCTAAASYQVIAIIAAAVHQLRAAPPLPRSFPPVSILKPVRGRDERIYEALRSHAVQDYPEYEILFGVADAADPAVAEIERLRAEYPDRPIRLVHSTSTAPNGKVAILIDLSRQARSPVLIVNDSDMTVPPDYLRYVVSPLARENIGLVTCLYRVAADTLPAKCEALGISTDFAPSVLVAPLFGVNEFALGSTMAFRASDLARIGGFESIAAYIADDYHLGKRISRLGLRVQLSTVVVQTRIEARTWRDAWRHQVRWAKTVRLARRAGFAGLPVTNATLWSVLAFAAGLPVAGVLLMMLRYATAFAGAAVVRDRMPLRLWYMIPFRDLWALAVWIAAWAPGEVVWRDRRLRLDSQGRILPVK